MTDSFQIDEEQAVAEIEAGIAFLEIHGWIQKSMISVLEDGDVSVCLIGAVTQGNLPINHPLPGLIYLNLFIKATTEYSGASLFNDAEGRTKEEVLDVMRNAVSSLRSRAS